MPMPNRQMVGGELYRYSFQGQEKDPETGKEAFQLRLWDGRIGRWLTTDPAGQYASPYLGMGNNPINGVDPDGGCDQPDSNCGWFKRLFYSSASIDQWNFWKDNGFSNNDMLFDPIVVTGVSNATNQARYENMMRDADPMNIGGIQFTRVDSQWDAAMSQIALPVNMAMPSVKFPIPNFFKSPKFNLKSPNSFKGMNPTKIKTFLKKQGWEITNLRKGKPGFRAKNPNNKYDVIQVNTGNAPKLKTGTDIELVKQGAYLNRNHLGWERIPLRGNPAL